MVKRLSYTHELTKIMQCRDMVGILPQYKSVHLLCFVLLLKAHVTVAQQLHSIQVIWVQFCQSGEEFHRFCVPVMMKLVPINIPPGQNKDICYPHLTMKVAFEMTVHMLVYRACMSHVSCEAHKAKTSVLCINNN